MTEQKQITGPSQLVSLHQVIRETVDYANRGIPFTPVVAEFIRSLNDQGNDANKAVLQVYNANRAERMHKLMSSVDRLEDIALKRAEYLEFADLLNLLKHLSERADKEFEHFKNAISEDPDRNIFGTGGPPSILVDARTINIGGNGRMDDLSAEDRGSIRSLFDGLKQLGQHIRQQDGQPAHTTDRSRAPGIPGSLKARRPE